MMLDLHVAGLMYSLMIIIVIISTVNGNCPEKETTSPVVIITNTSVNATPECVMPTDCKAWKKLGINKNGVYPIKPDNGPAFQVYCDMETDGGGWAVFQRRRDGSVDFYKYWTDYENGFGDLTGEFWLGLSKIHRLTKEGSNILRVELKDFENIKAEAKYYGFKVDDSTSAYRLTATQYSGTATDSLAFHNGKKFTTRDRNNDEYQSINCAQRYIGAWWFHNCHRSNLNGQYDHNPTRAGYGRGITWVNWKGYHYSLKSSEMKTRRNN